MKIVIASMMLFMSIFSFGQQDFVECIGAVGDVKYSILDIDKFQEVNGDCWILMDGRNIMSSKLGAMGFSHIPDAQGVFIRGMDSREDTKERQDNSREFGDPVGKYVEDAIKSHQHEYNDYYFVEQREHYSEEAGLAKTTFVSLGNLRGSGNSDSDNDLWQVPRQTAYSPEPTIERPGPGPWGGVRNFGETRPKSISIYTYIRIN